MEIKMINDRKYFVYNVEETVRLDYIAVRMMEQNSIEGLLPFQYVQQGKDKYFRYEVRSKETLKEWLARTQYREQVLGMIDSMIMISTEMDAYLLEQDHIYTDSAFIAVKDNKCELAYIPNEKERGGSVLQLVQEVVTSVKYALDSNFSYLFELQNAFGRKDIQTMADLKKWIRIIKGEEKMPDISDEDAVNDSVSIEGTNSFINPSSLISEKEEHKDAFEAAFSDIGFDSRGKDKKAGKEREKHGFFSKKKKGKSENGDENKNMAGRLVGQRPDIPQREIINDLDRGDSTVMIGTEMTPVLVQSRTGAEHSLLSDSYVIGSGTQADIIVQNNPTVSRKHARFFRNNGSYYIEDLGSTNGTSVNGEKLKKMEPYKLDDKARIKLSDEAYIFERRR